MPAAHFVWRQRSKWDKMFPWKEKYFFYRDGIYIPIQSRFLTNVIRLCLLSRGSGRHTEPRHRHAANLVFFYWFQPLFSVLCFNINMFSTVSTLFELAMDSLSQTRCMYFVFTQNSPFSLRFLAFLGVPGWDDVIKHSAPGPRESGWYGASWFVKWIKGKL